MCCIKVVENIHRSSQCHHDPSQLPSSSLFKHSSSKSVVVIIDNYCHEIQTFVGSYWTLREVEKKMIAEWGKPIPSSHSIRTTLRNILMESIENSNNNNNSMERYVGGFKERAREKYNAGIASGKDMAVLEGNACAWCRKDLLVVTAGVDSTYCSKECAETGRIRRGGMYASTRIRSQLFTLEGGICQICKRNANGKKHIYIYIYIYIWN